jgi:hypothetical protein
MPLSSFAPSDHNESEDVIDTVTDSGGTRAFQQRLAPTDHIIRPRDLFLWTVPYSRANVLFVKLLEL